MKNINMVMLGMNMGMFLEFDWISSDQGNF